MSTIGEVRRKVIHFDVVLNIASPAVALEAVAERARMLWVHLLYVGVSFHVVGVWRRHVLVDFTHEQGPTNWRLVMFWLRGVMNFLFKKWINKILGLQK